MAKISPAFVEHISQQLTDPSQLQQLIDYCHKPLRKSIRVNTLKTSVEQFFQDWTNAGFELIPIPWCKEGFWIDESVKPLPAGLGNFLPHLQGSYYIQEASSMLPVTALFHACSSPDMVLDVAAAPGSKTTQIAANMDNQGLIVANELSSSRLKGLFSNIQRCGVRNVCLTHADGRIFGDKAESTFDAILLDAPCGGEGTVRKDEDALQDWNIDSVNAMAHLQKELILSAFRALKPGGTLVYSTCTLSFEENQQVCKFLLEHFSEQASVVSLDSLFEGAQKAVTAEGYLHVYPHIFDSEGFFVACFKKTDPVCDKAATPESIDSRFPFTPIDKKSYSDLRNYCSSLGWNIESIQSQIWLRKNELWYFPKGIERLIGKVKMDRMGVKIAESHKSGFRLQHQAVIAFAKQFSIDNKCFSLTEEQAVEYYQGKDIFADNLSNLNKGEIIIKHNDIVLGLGKNLGNKLKNSLPRELVRDNPFSQL
ncbi:MAG: 16S rRNA (cytosine(1407)-C(5))-methyltransferase RsmF [Kangiellaceae bacterium]|nr:16S rRNA (cytosine(1407)-C(5))-methyltransferase RsmF [Kangiellaceae bacterium]